MFVGVQGALAGFVGPVALINAISGSDDLNVGFEKSQYGVGGGDLLKISEGGIIIIGDEVNCRVMLYGSEGAWLRNIYPQQIECPEDLGWPEYLKAGKDGFVVLGDKFQKYDYNGNLIFSIDSPGFIDYAVTPSGSIYYQLDRHKYQKYSPTGELLATYDKKPLELGIKTAHRRAAIDNKYDTTIRYEDMTYHMILDGDWDNFVRDQNDYLYFFNSYTAKDSVSGEDSTTSLVVKYDSCGKKIGRLDLPISEYEKPTQAELDMPTTTLRVRNEFGPPVIGPDGSVYCWKRTPDTYSILKWTWVDSPDDPQPGPDAPSNLTVQLSIDGLYLTWGASPQDPGCVDGYEVERATSAGGIYTSVKTTDPGVLKFNDTGALPGSTYFYKVRAKGGGEFSPHTAEVSGSRIQ
jgi:hypothetical protein